MSIIDDLKPQSRLLVMDLLNQAGIDIYSV